MSSVGRNERCPCGSGLKFKKCCLSNGSKGTIEASVQKLKSRAISFFEGDKSPLYVRDFKGIKKMSEVILEFAEPLLNNVDASLETQKKVLTVAILAWNIALMSNIDEHLGKLISVPCCVETPFVV